MRDLYEGVSPCQFLKPLQIGTFYVVWAAITPKIPVRAEPVSIAANHWSYPGYRAAYGLDPTHVLRNSADSPYAYQDFMMTRRFQP
jgi:hypothetical protein